LRLWRIKEMITMALARKRVLWVDDEIEFLRAHIMFLETRGYSVTPVFNGDDALHILREQPKNFDIVLLDEQMPGMDGLTVLEEIKEMQPDLPVVMVTKSEEERVMEDALGKKIDSYLTKPVNPSQILSVCKKLLDSKQIISSQISQRYARGFSDIRNALQNATSPAAWAKIYDALIRWDFELQKAEDEGVRQTHMGQKSDANKLFCSYYIDNYLRWINGQGDALPVLSPRMFDVHVAPHLSAGKRVYFFVFDSMRADQSMALEPLLSEFYTIARNYYYSILPTASEFTAETLLSGMYPQEIADMYPGESRGKREEKLFMDRLDRSKFGSAGAAYVSIDDMRSGHDFLGSLMAYREKCLVAIRVNFFNMLQQGSAQSQVIQEMSSDENAFRMLAASWFQYSSIYQILRELTRQDCVVVMTATNGSVLSTRGTELYGQPCENNSLRFRFGENITSDERHSLFLAEPARFKIPPESPTSVGIVLKENFYFTHTDKFENYNRQYQNAFKNGGVSMEEVLCPVVVLKPR
jgi:CheY-like chemotaxis protein